MVADMEEENNIGQMGACMKAIGGAVKKIKSI